MRKSSAFILSAILLCFAALALTHCDKEYSYEGGQGLASSSGTAVYSFTGTSGNCLNYTIYGNYYAGTATGAGDTAVLQVDVTTAGTYTINTTSVNGFRFTATGSFSRIGIQTVTLKAAGTPTTAGLSNFRTPVGSGCTFSVTVTAAPRAQANFGFTGAPGACTVARVQGQYVAGTGLTNANTVDVQVNVTTAGDYSIVTDTLDNIYFSASGTFTVTGTQLVSLAGNGTPTIPDSLVFIPKARGTAGCSFNVAVLNPQPPATYVLESGFNAVCIGQPSGVYQSGQAMAAANFISISIYVSVLGNYTVATQTVNGIRFYATGTFTSTGTQKLILQATGKPLAAGDFNYVPKIIGPHPIGGEGCAFTVTVL